VDLLNVVFPVSGVQTSLLLPPLVALVISFFTSMGGISGAFLLLPFQVSVLHYTAPSVSGTNHVFNLVAIPSGVYRYIKEGRMAWPLAWVVVAGTLPGVMIGYYLRVLYLPDPRGFKLFAGCVLLYIGIRIVLDLLGSQRVRPGTRGTLEEKFRAKVGQAREQKGSGIAAGLPAEAVVRTVRVSLRRVEYEFWGERYSFSTPGMFGLACIVGVIGGAYGIGGGAIIAPFCIAFFHLPVYTIAGATLTATFITSAAGALFFTLMPAVKGISSFPDWPLGILFGLGGLLGIYTGARIQKFVPQKVIKAVVGFVILFVAAAYIRNYILP
jgi:uncharacterized membrane protein YfcA